MDDNLLMYEIDADADDYTPPELINTLNPEKLLILKEEINNGASDQRNHRVL